MRIILSGGGDGEKTKELDSLFASMSDKSIKKTKIIKYIGILDFSLEVHYDGSQDEELNKLKKLGDIYLVPEKCALICTNKSKKFIGNIKTIKR